MADIKSESAGEAALCYVYVLGSISDCVKPVKGGKKGSPRTYTGWTHNVEARLVKHNAGQGAKATRGRQWSVLHIVPFETRGEALSQEAAMKKRLRQDPAFRAALLAPLMASLKPL